MPESRSRIDGVAVVTGAGRGLGAAIAAELCACGARVIVADIDEANARITAHALTQKGYVAEAVQADVTDERAIETLGNRAAAIGNLVAWVNNAGITDRTTLTEMTLAQWTRIMNVNSTSAFLGTRAAARRMKDGGAIVNVASISSLMALPNNSHYGASKGAVAAFTRHAAIDLGSKGIRVNAVAPGTTRTAMTEERLSKPGQLDWTLDRIPLRRIGEPADIASVIAFLCSPSSSFVTGVVLPCDGGWTASA